MSASISSFSSVGVGLGVGSSEIGVEGPGVEGPGFEGTTGGFTGGLVPGCGFSLIESERGASYAFPAQSTMYR